MRRLAMIVGLVAMLAGPVAATVTDTYAPVSYACAGLDTYTFDFPIFATSDLVVTLRTDATGDETTLAETTHYSVSATNDDYSDGGTVTTVATYSAGYTLVISRDVPATQSYDVTASPILSTSGLENVLDRVVILVQQIENMLAERVLLAPVSDSADLDLTLPDSVDRASKYLAFDSDGAPVASSGPTGDSSIPVSAYVETILDDANNIVVWTTLGIATYIQGLLDDANSVEALTTLGVTTWAQGFVADVNAVEAYSTLGIATYVQGLLDDANATEARATLIVKADDVSIEYDETDGFAVKDNGASYSSQVVGTTNIANDTGAWADVNDMTITFTTRGGNVLLMFSATMSAALATDVDLRFDCDGSPYHHISNDIPANDSETMAMQYLVTGLAAGSHTFKVQWVDANGGDAEQDGASYPRVFTVTEFRK